MGNVGFREYLNIARPAKELIEMFRDIPAANIDDNMNRMYSISMDIVPFNKAPLLGSAFTVKVPAGDNLMVHRALDIAEPGDIIVVDAGGCSERAICGEIMVKYAIKRGLGGFVINGCIRDADELAALDFPVYARGVNPNGPYKNGPGEINVAICVGGMVVMPGDILVGDGDGIVIIRQSDALEVVKKAKAQNEKEIRDIAAINRGDFTEGGFCRDWVRATLNSKGCQFFS